MGDCRTWRNDGRQCELDRYHGAHHRFPAIEGETCTCILRVYPNRCKAHPERNQPQPMTFGDLKAELDKLTPEQLAQRAAWFGDDRGGYVNRLCIEPEDMIGDPSDHETWIPRSDIAAGAVDAKDYEDAVVCVSKGTVALCVD